MSRSMSEMVATGDFDAPLSPHLHPDESEVPSNIRVSLETLLELGIDPRVFRPVVKSSQTGEIVDGLHRLEADPTWPTMEGNFTPLQMTALRLVYNWNRRLYSNGEMAESLDSIAEETGWAPKDIAEKFGMSYRTVLHHISPKYKRSYSERGAAAAASNSQLCENEDYSGLIADAPAAIGPRHEILDVRVPGWLQQKFDELDKERAEEDEADRADEGPSETDTETISEDPPEENAIQSGTVEVVLPVEEEEPEPKTPEETLAEIYDELPVPPPTRFLQTALRRDFPNLSEQQIDEIIEETRPPEPDRLKSVYGFACPTCGTWKPPSSMKRILRELEKKDPDLAALVKERLEKQGLIA